ncbi:MAG: DUF1846 domain-containing protein [Bacillota bacterium]|nr:DUF1846 domain-containing protein [Bacillota bacterium]
MPFRIGFDAERYLEEQSRYIRERLEGHDRLYLEFGGKLMEDLHAARVLPGFDAQAKIKVLERLRADLEVLICIFAEDIEQSKVRGDFGITYDLEVLRMIDNLRERGLEVNSVVLTRYEGQASAERFIRKLERRGISVYCHGTTVGYPFDVDAVLSEQGYGRNVYIPCTRRLVVVTAPGPASGKLSTCLSQLYHEMLQGMRSGYSKFETFPIWNLPLHHPVNLAYEAATAELRDVNMIDPYHLEATGQSAVNYNRDVEAFLLLRRMFERLAAGGSTFRSPTDMGVNRAGFCIIDDEIVREASCQEIIRRSFHLAVDYRRGQIDYETLQRVKLLLKNLELKDVDRPGVREAREYAARLGNTGDVGEEQAVAALELPDRRVVTGRGSDRMTAPAALLLNAVKQLAGIDDSLHLLSPVVLEPIYDMKRDILGLSVTALDCREVLMALGLSAATNPLAQLAMDRLAGLRHCQAHVTVIASRSDADTYRQLGIDMTNDPVYATDKLYYES